MCGICGKYHFDDQRPVDDDFIRRMARALERRGPDGEGFFFSGHVGLGSRRLNILGGREDGGQPFYNENGSVCVIYNGEIYNHAELQTELRKHGHILKGRCDGEVIAHLYEEYGEDFLMQMHGMFAVVLYDREKDLIILARDRMGIKPLFYSLTSEGILFSSSLRSLLLEGGISEKIDPAALQHYFAYNYFPEDMTPFLGVRKLRPGYSMTVDRQGSRLRRYWTMPERDRKGQETDIFESRFHAIFKETIKRHLMADVPVGVWLSGGMDSSYLAYTVKEVAGQVNTFTIGFRESSFDERAHARRVAKELGACHREIEIPEDIPSVVRKIAASMDIPIGEPSLFPTFELAAYTRQYCGVVLSGEGADELFLGYETYKADRLLAFVFSLPRGAREGFFKQLSRFFPRTSSRLSLRFRLDLIARTVAGRKELMHYGWREVFSSDERRKLYLTEAPDHCTADAVFDAPSELFLKNIQSAPRGDYIDRSNLFDLNVWLPDSILQRVDMASMHHGLEVRVPFLDDEIVNLACRLPQDVLLKALHGKDLFRKILRRKLPPKVLNRPKQGFSVPMSAWLQKDLVQFYNDMLESTSRTCGSFLNYDHLRILLREHQSGKFDHGRRLWNVLMYIVWHHSLGEGH